MGFIEPSNWRTPLSCESHCAGVNFCFFCNSISCCPSDFVEVVFVLFLERIVIEQGYGELLSNPPDWYPADWAEV